MRQAIITLHKGPIHDFVDAATYKRVLASLPDAAASAKDAIASDSEEVSDSFIIEEYCDRRDARLRSRLQFCLQSDTPIPDNEVLSFDNSVTYEDAYVFNIVVDDSVSADKIKSCGKKMDEYIKRGAIFSWYLNAGLDPNDTEMSLQELEDDIVYSLRGQAWGHRPLQPFGPRLYNGTVFRKGTK